MPPPKKQPRRSTRNVQTRLSFEPSSSARASSAISPARIIYQHPQIRNKKNFSSSARSQPHISDGDEDDVFANGKKYAVVVESSPNSKNSSQFPATSFMAAASSSVNKSRKAPAYQTRDDSSSDEEIPRAETPKSKKKPVFLNDDSESPLESPTQATVRDGVAQTPKKPSTETKKRHNISTRNFIAGGQLAPGSMTTPRSAKSKSSRLSAKKSASHKLKEKEKETITLSSDEDSDSNGQESSDDEHKQTAMPSRKRAHESEGEDSDEIVELHSSARKRQPSNRPAQADGDDEKAKRTYPTLKRRRLADLSEEDDDDEPIQSSPAKRRKSLRPEEQSDDSDFNLPIPVRRRLEDLSEENDEDEPIQSSPTKRRKPQRPEEQSDGSDFNSPKPARRLIATPRRSKPQTPKKHRTEKQKKLELIKRRRAGEKIDELTESSEEEDAEKGVYDTDSDVKALSVFEDEDSEDAIEEVRKSLRRSVRDDNDDSFVVEDDEAPLGVPSYGLHDIPLEFTHQAHKPPKEHFKDAVEWMVQRQINPSFNRRDPIYVQAFRKLEPEARGLAHSKFSSASWSTAFTRALWARPAFHEEDIGGEGEGRKCDACGRSNKPAKFRVQLKGKAYHQDTLEEVDNEDDGSDDAEDDDASINSKGQEIAKEDKEYYLGRFCKANAERAHSLIHWKHALNEWVVAALETQGYLAPEKLAERVRWNQRKLNDFANGIVDEWVEIGEIKALYRDFKNNLEAARSGTQDRWNA